MSEPGALAHLRVLEIGEHVSAAYATKLLADLGADVIKIEPPGTGDAARRHGPFPRGISDPNASGLFLYLNANKRGITVDLTAPEGIAVLDRLAATVDVLIHNVHPTDMAAHGLDFERLHARNRGLVMTSIAPFGHEGPRAAWTATDLVSWCAGGLATLNGDRGRPDLPPLKAFGEQASYQAGLNAAVASLGVLFGRRRTGLGDHVRISVEECILNLLELTFEYWPYCGLVASRLGAKPIQPLCFMECRDGWIFICCVEEHQWKGLVDLMGNPEWADMELFATRLDRGKNFDALQIFLQDWCREQSVVELYEAAQARRIPLAPASTMGDLLASPHLAARGFFAKVTVPGRSEGASIPGAPCLFSETPWRLRRPAPMLGQHTAEVLGELGMSVATATAEDRR